MGIKDRDFLSLMEKRTFAYEDNVALGIRSNFGWKEFTYKGIGLLSRKLATHLIYDLDTKKGQRLAILSESKPEYGACVFASTMAGFVTVPLDIKLTKYELKSILYIRAVRITDREFSMLCSPKTPSSTFPINSLL